MRQGLVHIYTGDGKGKTTCAVGLATRAAGHGFKVLFVQFFKMDEDPSGEKDIFRTLLSDRIELVRGNCRHPIFTGDATDLERVQGSVDETFKMIKEKVATGEYDMLVMDEVMSAVVSKWLDLTELIGFLTTKPGDLEVVLTGRNAPSELVQISDYTTEMLLINHPFKHGIHAREGIEF